MLEEIRDQENTIAIILRATHRSTGIEFLTPKEFSQQLGYMHHPAGYKIAPHIHNVNPRLILYSQEVIVVKSGSLRIDFYTHAQDYLESRVLKTGDVILIASGGHGFEMLENTEIIEIKQGPYTGINDRTIFESKYPGNISHVS